MESRDKAVSAALPPPFPGEKQREAETISYFMPLACGSKNIIL